MEELFMAVPLCKNVLESRSPDALCQMCYHKQIFLPLLHLLNMLGVYDKSNR